MSRNHRALDKIDWEIVRLLNEDGRMSNAEMARRLGGSIPRRTVSHRVKGLLERDVIAVRAIVNPVTLGYNVLADVFIQVEPGYMRSVAERVAEFPQASYVACATGDCDVSVSLRVRSNEELFDFVTEQLSKIPGVRRTQTFLLPVKIKDMANWLPDVMLTALADAEGEPPE